MNTPKNRPLRAGESYYDLLILLASIVLLVIAYRISGFKISAPGTFPLASTTVMVAAMLTVIWSNRKRKRATEDGFGAEIRQMLHEVFTRDFVVYAILCIAYVALIQPTHFLPSSFVFLVASIFFLKGGGPLKAVLVSAGTLACIYLIFLYFFQVLLP